MMKAYCRSRWAIWLLLATLLATGFLASWLLANSFEIVLNMWFFATAPLAVIVSIDYWRFRREWQQLQDDHPIDPVQITDPLSLAYYQKIQTLTQKLRTTRDTAHEQEQETLDTLQLWTHQIKTPLTALDLLLQVEPVNAKDARLEISKIDRYLAVMLNYLKLTTLNTDLVLTELPLKPLVNETVRDLAKLFIAKDLTVTVGPLPTVISDSQWLHFIFEQLLTNAIKYTPRIFEQGYSGYNGRANQKASGLGLFLSKQIAEKLGLTLTVTSEIGQGSTFAIHFPQTRWQVE